MIVINLTAATLQSTLMYIDPKGGPKIATDKLVRKVRRALGENNGSTSLGICFSDKEDVVLQEFCSVALNIANIFFGVAQMHK